MRKGKEQLSRLAAILVRRGVDHAVVSPGSRNAPAIITFSKNGKIRLISVADERSAGFFALGMAQQLGRPVALLCTSGSAAVNYGPALSEAYYQKVPLLVITADRPGAWIDQGDGQTIRQERLFANFIRKNYNLPEDTTDPVSRWYFDRMVNEAVDYTLFPARGPVHLNLPVSEPLYDLDIVTEPEDLRVMEIAPAVTRVSPFGIQKLAEDWNASTRKMILVGQMPPSPEMELCLERISADPSVVVLTETTSNIRGSNYVTCIDRVIEGLSSESREYVPEILLSIGGAVVSKKIKSLLREMRPAHHWHVNPDTAEFHMDTYQSLTVTIPSEAANFLNDLSEKTVPVQSGFRGFWEKRNLGRRTRHGKYMAGAGYSDLKVYELLFGNMPAKSHVHLGNSTPVRYAQLFEQHGRYRFWSNRGASGIDGCVSTAAGSALIAEDPVTVITGDIGFFYDSNALWNHNLTPNFRIILINNGGGNIFRILPGPDRYAELEPFLETAHTWNASGICENFGLTYHQVGDLLELGGILPSFYRNTGKPALLEIFTPGRESAETLRNYFKYMIQ